MRKTLQNVTIKDVDQGLVEAVFSTLGVVDKDGDVTVKGAVDDGAPVVISAYGHKSWYGELPVGKGTIHEIGDELVLKGQFFLNTSHGRDTFETVKELSAEGLQEWSFSLENVVAERAKVDGQSVRVIKKVSIKEVSPVLVGAGIDTRTLATKADAKQLHSSIARLLSLAGRARWGTAWWVWVEDYDLDANVAVFGVEDRDECRLVQVTFTRTDTAVELGDVETDVHETRVYLPKSRKGSTFLEHADAVMADVDALIARASEVVALRAEKGKSISEDSAGLLTQLTGSLDRLKAVIDTPTPASNTDDVAREYLQFVALSQGVTS